MMLIPHILVSILPNPVKRIVYRIIGFDIGENVSLGFCAILCADKCRLEKGVRIAPFTIFMCKKSLIVKKNVIIKGLTIFKANRIYIGENCHFSPLIVIHGGESNFSRFYCGMNCGFGPFSWIDTVYGVYFGSNTGCGGKCLIFTHGVWQNYFKGGTLKYGSVRVREDAWIPWGVNLLPGSYVGPKSIVNTGTTVIGKVPPNSVVMSSNTKNIPFSAFETMTSESLRFRLSVFYNFVILHSKFHCARVGDLDLRINQKIITTDLDQNKEGDFLLILSSERILNESEANFSAVFFLIDGILKTDKHSEELDELIGFLRGFGVRC